MSETPETDPIKGLEGRIQTLRKAQERTDRPDEHFSTANMAWRMVIELVAGLGVGFGFGYGLDWLFGTKPFLMVIFIFLGLIAGVQTMMRTAKELQEQQAAKAAQEKTQD